MRKREALREGGGGLAWLPERRLSRQLRFPSGGFDSSAGLRFHRFFAARLRILRCFFGSLLTSTPSRSPSASGDDDLASQALNRLRRNPTHIRESPPAFRTDKGSEPERLRKGGGGYREGG